MNEIKALGKKVTKFRKLETFPKPPNVTKVIFTSDEVTANCPVTEQPDWYNVTVEYDPDKRCVESKTIKLYLQSFRDAGHFCENFSSIICDEFHKALEPKYIRVEVTQKARGGVSIISVAERHGPRS